MIFIPSHHLAILCNFISNHIVHESIPDIPKYFFFQMRETRGTWYTTLLNMQVPRVFGSNQVSRTCHGDEQAKPVPETAKQQQIANSSQAHCWSIALERT